MGGRRFQDVITALGVVVLLGVCVVFALIVFSSDKPVDTANIVAGVVAPAAIVVPALVWLVRRWRKRRQAPAVSTAAQLAQAADQLAQAVLATWRQEAADRRITTPAPVRVQWHWSSEQVWSGHRSADELVPGAGPPPIPTKSTAVGEVLAAGVVTQLHDELYTRLPHGRLVLTGVGGAGKTGAMILLLLAALAHRNSIAPEQRDQVPVPVWLTLGGWNPQTQSLPEWASATIYRDHPYLRSPEFGPDAVDGLLRSGRVALFLDGLDEIAPELRTRALQQVEAASAGLRIVLTSRPEEYQQASQSSRWHNVAEVQLCPVEPTTAHTYLITDQHGDQRDGWDQVGAFLQAHPDSVAARVLNTPLTLSLARDAYRHADPRVLTTEFTDEQALRGHLIDRSLTVVYPDDRQRAHATYWLGWIAHHMSPHSRDLAWWQIPTWVNQRRLRLTTALLVATVTTLIVGLTIGLTIGLTVGLAVWLGISIGDESKSFSLRWPQPRELASGLAGGLVLGLGTAVTDSRSFAVLMSQIVLKTRATGYVRFLPLLQDASDRQMLRQAGTVYQFRHAALQDHLAEMYRQRYLS